LTSTTRKSLAIAAVSVLLVAFVYYVLVRTGTGQRFEDAVWRGAGQTAMQRPAQANRALNLIGNWTSVAAVAVVLLIGVLRRQIAPAIAGVAVIGASAGTTEFLKRSLHRPDLDPGAFNAGNSFPSGHTTIAMAVMCALILVAPYPVRSLIALCAAAAATEIGALTIIARWHRPSDTLGADLVVLFYASLAVLVLAASGRIRPRTPGTLVSRAARSVTLGPIAIGTAVTLFGAVLCGALTYYHVVNFSPGYEVSHYALYAGCLIALAGSGLVTLALLWLLAGVELTSEKI
jgi:membrane-associated phospholipid phosphatase